MEYQLQFKKFEKKDGDKCKIICLTDFTIHTANKRSTQSIGKKIKQAFDNNQPDRIYFPIKNGEGKELSADIDILGLVSKDPELIKLIQEWESQGYKVLLEVPKTGVPIIPGKDTKEFIESKKGKRIIRGLAKNNRSDKM